MLGLLDILVALFMIFRPSVRSYDAIRVLDKAKGTESALAAFRNCLRP